jgi:hypothetical protein
LETLPDAQRQLWPQLSAVGSEFVLYGSTALSLKVCRVGKSAPVSRQSESLLPGDKSIVRSHEYDDIVPPRLETNRKEPELEI